jgi:hypothetical protein
MSVCEIIFSSNKYPSLKSQIKKAYILKSSLDKSISKMRKLYQEGSDKTQKEVEMAVKLSAELIEVNPLFVDFICCNDRFHAKKKKISEEIGKADMDLCESKIRQLKELDSSFKDLGFNSSKLIKSYLECKKTKDELSSYLFEFERIDPNIRNYLISLYR